MAKKTPAYDVLVQELRGELCPRRARYYAAALLVYAEPIIKAAQEMMDGVLDGSDLGNAVRNWEAWLEDADAVQDERDAETARMDGEKMDGPQPPGPEKFESAALAEAHQQAVDDTPGYGPSNHPRTQAGMDAVDMAGAKKDAAKKLGPFRGPADRPEEF